MSPVIAFDIAVVAQKVKSSIEDRCVSEKWLGGGGVDHYGSRWLLELLTELIKNYKPAPDPQQKNRFAIYYGLIGEQQLLIKTAINCWLSIN